MSDSVLLYHPVDIRQEGPVGVLLLLLTPLHPHLDGGVVEGQLHLLAVHGQLDHVAGDLARVVSVGDNAGDEDTEAVNIASLDLGRFFIYFFHCSKFYTLPFYYLGNAISKTASLSSLAHLLPVLVNFDPP